MTRPVVVMLVKNSFEYDARVRKEATALVAAGARVHVVAIHVPGVTQEREIRPDGIEVVRVPRLYGRLARLAGDSTVTPGAAITQSAGRSATVRTPARRLTTALRYTARRLAAPLRLGNGWVLDARMLKSARSLQPDVVHAHDLNTLAAGRRASRQLKVPLIYDAHELHQARNGTGPLHRAVARTNERRHLRQVDAVITATGTWADIMVRDYGLPRRPTVLRNVPELVDSPTARDLRSVTGIPPQCPVLVYQGSIQKGRGIAQTIDALRLLPDCHLAVIGYGAHRPSLERRAARLGLANRVHFTGPIDNTELPAWTASADVGTCLIMNTSLSYYTSLPNKLFEYMLAGVPVVASDFPEMGRVVRTTGAGELCDPSDPEDLAKAVRRVLDDPAPYQRRAAEAIRQHHWGREQEALLSVYRSLNLLKPVQSV